MAGGHAKGTMDVDSNVCGCVNAGRTAHKWYQCDVSRKDTRGIVARRKEAQGKGRKLAEDGKIGQWVAVQNRADDGDPYLVGRLVDGGNGSPIAKKVTESTVKINGTTFTNGDYVMAIEWFSRDPADSQRLTFMGDADDTPGSIQFEVVNSTELRAINLKMTAVRRPGASTRRRAAVPQRYTLNAGDEWVVISACW